MGSDAAMITVDRRRGGGMEMVGLVGRTVQLRPFEQKWREFREEARRGKAKKMRRRKRRIGMEEEEGMVVRVVEWNDIDLNWKSRF